MNQSENIKAELSNFWLKQVDEKRANPLHGTKDKPSQRVSTLVPDMFLQRQLQRVSGHVGGNREKNGSAGMVQIADERPSTVVKLESSRDASTADPLRKWLDPNAAAEQCEGRFYIKAVDVLSLTQAQRDWNCPAGNVSEPNLSHPNWLTDDRLMWLSAPSS